MNKLLLALFLISTLSLQSCGDGKKEASNTEYANEMNEGQITGLNTDATEFAVDAANGSMLEVQLSELALKKSPTPALREYANMMIKDHEKANAELKALAASKNITLPTTPDKDNQETYEKMDELTGSDFNAQYAKTMLKSHKKTVEMFEKAAQDVKNADVRAFAIKTLPTLKMHLKHIEDIEAER